MCVLYARSLSDFTIHGNAWTWWNQAADRYGRGHRPEVGSVLVFERSRAIPLGHVAVVSGIVNSREIKVDHSWLNGQGLYRGMLVLDTSPRNDWSQVRVWDPAIHGLGNTNYPTYGFIYPHGGAGGHVVETELASREPSARPRMVASAGRYGRFAIPEPERKPNYGRMARMASASFDPLPGHKPEFSALPRAATALAMVIPSRKPDLEWVLPAQKPVARAAVRMTEVATRPGAPAMTNLGD